MALPPVGQPHGGDRPRRRARCVAPRRARRCASRSRCSPTSATSTTSAVARSMDAGCYAVHMVRTLGGEEPEVVSATPKLRGPDIDRAMRAELRFPIRPHRRRSSARCGRRRCSSCTPGWSASAASCACSTRRTRRCTTGSGSRSTVRAGPSTSPASRPYDVQLEAFCAAVLRGEPTLTPPSDSVANMRVIDAIYRAAGMKVRGT